MFNTENNYNQLQAIGSEQIVAEIITIGDEILIGQIVDTNSAWMGQELNKVGIRVHQITSVSDNERHILQALDQACSRSQVVLVTGGLGPTKDDITKSVLAVYFNSKQMVLHDETLRFIEQMFARRGYPMSDLNRRQAEVPDCCTVIPNTCGTAPAMCFDYNITMPGVVVAMPGVPHEMKNMFPSVLEYLKSKFTLASIYHRTAMTYGIPESLLAEQIREWENALPQNLKLAYLPDMETGVKLRLSAYNADYGVMQAEVENRFSSLKHILGSALYAYAPDTLESVIGKLLIEKGATLAMAESCTGGRIAHRITSVPGSSAYFKGGLVAYSDEAKANILGVDKNDLLRYGAVSEQVAIQMAEGARKILKADFAIATTGIAGPGGGSAEKPVGLCWIAISGPDGTKAQAHNFNYGRLQVIATACSRALNELRLVLSY